MVVSITMLGTVLLGFAIGYLAATISESLLHRFVGHARFKARTRWRQFPVVSSVLPVVHFGHTIVHHGKTFRSNHVLQFRTDAEQARLDQELLQLGKSNLIKLRYGLTTDVWGACWFVLPPFCVVVGFMALILGKMSAPFLAGALVPLILAPVLSKFLHPYLHVRTSEARTSAPPFTAWLLSTRYGRWVRAAHYVHHAYPRFNFNLLPGGDYLLGTYRAPTSQDRDAMLAIGLLDVEET